uniref:Transposase n=1 Tax=Ditylenchus dipsaci TaxID=166011 RepID=A0A915D2C6_9BILA
MNFVDPESGAHTQAVESLWQKYKKRHKNEFGTARSLFKSYISDFVWRRKFDGSDIFFHLWSQISEIYVCDC